MSRGQTWDKTEVLKEPHTSAKVKDLTPEHSSFSLETLLPSPNKVQGCPALQDALPDDSRPGRST